jgi:hypothetical protein
LVDCWNHFGTSLAPVGDHVGSYWHPWNLSAIMGEITSHVGTIWGPFGDPWGPFWEHLGPSWLHLLTLLFRSVLACLFRLFLDRFGSTVGFIWRFFRSQSDHCHSHGIKRFPQVKLIIPRIPWLLSPSINGNKSTHVLRRRSPFIFVYFCSF